MSTEATADSASCSTLATFIATLEKSESKIWKHIRHCLSSDKAISTHKVQKLLCVDAAASDAENLCKWCLASFVDIFWEFLFQNLLNDSARRVQYVKHVSFSHFNRSKRILYSCHRNLLQIGNVDQELSFFGYQTDNLKAENYSATHFLRKWSVFELWFL